MVVAETAAAAGFMVLIAVAVVMTKILQSQLIETFAASSGILTVLLVVLIPTFSTGGTVEIPC